MTIVQAGYPHGGNSQRRPVGFLYLCLVSQFCKREHHLFHSNISASVNYSEITGVLGWHARNIRIAK